MLLFVQSGENICCIEVGDERWKVVDQVCKSEVVPTLIIYPSPTSQHVCEGVGLKLGEEYNLNELTVNGKPLDQDHPPTDGCVNCGGFECRDRPTIGMIIPPDAAFKMLVRYAPRLDPLPASMIALSGVADGRPPMLETSTTEFRIHIIELLKLADTGLLTRRYRNITSETKWVWREKLHQGEETLLYLPSPEGWHSALQAAATHFAIHRAIDRFPMHP